MGEKSPEATKWESFETENSESSPENFNDFIVFYMNLIELIYPAGYFKTSKNILQTIIISVLSQE